MPGYLLDASALLAFLYGEPGSARVRELLRGGGVAMTVINVSEVVSKLVSRGAHPPQAERDCRDLGLDFIEIGEAIAFAAAALSQGTRRLGLSLGDRVCLATAALRGLVAVTADKAWEEVPGVKVEVVR